MALRLLSVLTVIVVLGVTLSTDPNRRIKDCMHEKYRTSFGREKYDNCIETKRDLEIPEMKQCYQDFMKEAGVVKVKSGGQMTVVQSKFKEYADEHRTKPVGQAMIKCHAGKTAQDNMWKEAARASQCVFETMKQTCNN